MGQALALEELQGAVDGRRLGRLAVLAEAGDQIVGLDRFAGAEQQGQHPQAGRGQPFALGGQPRTGGGEGAFDLRCRGRAVGVIMMAGVAHASQLVARRAARNGAGLTSCDVIS